MRTPLAEHEHERMLNPFTPAAPERLPEWTVAEHAEHLGITAGAMLDHWPKASLEQLNSASGLPPILAGLLHDGVPRTIQGTVTPQTGAITLGDLIDTDDTLEVTA